MPITQDPCEDLNADAYEPTARDLKRALADVSLEDWQGTPTPAAAPPDQDASTHDMAPMAVSAAAGAHASVPCSTPEQRYDAMSSEVRQAYGPLAYSIHLDVQLDLITVTEPFTQLPQKVNRLRSTLYVYDRQCRPLHTDTPEVSLPWLDEIHELLGSGA